MKVRIVRYVNYVRPYARLKVEEINDIPVALLWMEDHGYHVVSGFTNYRGNRQVRYSNPRRKTVYEVEFLKE